MKSILKVLTVIALMPLLSACGSFLPISDLSNLSAQERNALYAVELYPLGGARAYPEDHTVLGSVEGHSCKNLATDPPATEAAALEQLRYNALELGANAVIEVTSSRTGTDAWGTNCWNSFTANGLAIVAR